MKTKFQKSPDANGMRGFIVFIITLFLLFFVLTRGAMAADSTATAADSATATVKDSSKAKATTAAAEEEPPPTDTMHQVLNELKAGNEDSPVMAVFMIIAIMGVVGLAIFLSFRDDGKSPPVKKKGAVK